MALQWWNTKYPFRHQLSVNALTTDVFPANHPVSVTLSKAKTIGFSKIRSDYEDLEVLHYSNGQATPVYSVLGRKVSVSGDVLTITFNTIESFTNTVGYYCLYYGNPKLTNRPIRPNYTEYNWPVSVSNESAGVSYTKPQVDWRNGISSTYNAKATFSFYGTKVRLKGNVSSVGGIGLVYIDDVFQQEVDFYSVTSSDDVELFSKEGLSSDRHSLEIVVSGRAAPASVGNEINIHSFEYLRYAQVTSAGEETPDTLTWTSVLVGGV